MKNIENRLLATHISNNKDFTEACNSNNVEKIMSIVDTEMTKNNLHTAGAEKLRTDIFRKLQSKSKDKCASILFFVWNSRLSGTDLAVIH